jgi:phosphate starvation-inducible protein PhoH
VILLKIRPKTENQKQYIHSLDVDKITFCEGPAGTGKAAPLDSIVYCPDGPKFMGDICVNDIVLTPHSGHARVLAVYPQGIKDIYKITFKDGSYVESCLEHLWQVYDSVSAIDKILPLGHLLHTYVTKNGRCRYHIKLPSAAQFNSKPVPMDPYLLGLLLGDGGLTGSIILTSADSAIIDYVKNILPHQHAIKKLKSDKYGYIISSPRGKKNLIRECLRDYGLKVKSEHKFIPREYKYNDITTRLAILQGLLDTDGSVSVSYRNNKATSSNIEYSTSSFQLSQDVKEIVESLGGICRIGSRYPKYTYNGEQKVGLKSYRCYIKLENYEPFRLKRKLNKMIKRVKYLPKRIVSDIQFSRTTYAKCIKIDDPNNLYLTNGFTPTHNTYLASLHGIEGLRSGKYKKLIISRPLVQSGENTGYLPGGINEKLDPYIKPIYDILDYAVNPKELSELIQNKKIEIVPFAYMRGRNFFESYIVLDEVQNCSYKQLILALTRFSKHSKMVLTGDSCQSDLPHNQQGGLMDIMQKLQNVKDIGIVHLKMDDIIREPIVKTILEKLSVGPINLDIS